MAKQRKSIARQRIRGRKRAHGKEREQRFPKFLPPIDKELLIKLGKRLAEIRKARPSIPAEVDEGLLKEMEAGEFDLSLGYLRLMLRDVYGVTLEDIIENLLPQERQPFNRDYVYSLRLRRISEEQKETPFLIGGDGQEFIWAVPLRRLKSSSTTTEYLELAPFRNFKRKRVTTGVAHSGVEVISVVHGTVDIHIESSEGPLHKELKEGQAVHFHSKLRHSVRNGSPHSPALLLIVRASLT